MHDGEHLRYLILGAQREGARILAGALTPLGVTAAQAEALTVIAAADEPLRLSELGAQLVCEAGSPSRLVTTLVRSGLVVRRERDGDRRSVELTLTRKGAALARRIAKVDETLHRELADALGPRDTRALIRGLGKLVEGRAAGQAIEQRRRSA
jgi:MarR family transcriptional regulator, organic hydroperoxide resistance regulator